MHGRGLLCSTASTAALANHTAVLVPGLALVTHPLAVGGLREGRVALGEGDGNSLVEHFGGSFVLQVVVSVFCLRGFF